ncbi:MAG: glycerate kinase, partial [Flavihumibacter sp.]
MESKSMRLLIAPNAFKNSLTATEAAIALRDGFAASRLQAGHTLFPVADGGDGTGDLLVAQLQGRKVNGIVNDPLGRPIDTWFGLIDEGRTAVVEMANASGLRLLQPEELTAMRANSFGTGQQIVQALDSGARKIIVAMGGSATTDGAIGMLQALGVRFRNSAGDALQAVPASFAQMDRIDLSALDPRVNDAEIIVLCDVDNRLLGAKGAAAMFGPQKGATPAEVEQLDKGLHRFAELVKAANGKDIAAIPYGGTAGGASAGLYACINAKLVHGIEYFLDITGFNTALENSDLVVTGEGSIDEQTLQGKAPFGVARRAKDRG